MKRIALSLLSLLTALSFVTTAKAVTTYALTDSNHLLRFDSATPGVAVDTAISGLPVGFSLVGMAIRTTTQTVGSANPGIGSIWGVATNGLGNDYRLMVINPSSGAATQIAALGNLGGSPGSNGWSLAFNPALDRFQFIGVEMNYQINPNTGGVLTQTSFTGFPAYSGAAFTTASFGGTSQFYNVDCGSTPDNLQTMANVSVGGTPTVVGPIGLADFSRPVGLAISQSTALFAVNGNLYSENLSTGAATIIGAIMGSPTVRGLAILPASFPPVLSVTVTISGKKKITTTKTSLVIKGTASSQAGITLVQYKIGKGGFKTASGTTSWKFKAKQLKPGVNKISVQATGGNAVVSSLAKVKVTVK